MSLIIVNGLPGSGKTTLATQLAIELSLPLFRKDAIKETLADALIAICPREETSIEWSQQLGRAAAACLWRLLSDAGGNAVIESPWLANLRPVVAQELHQMGILTHDEIWCDGFGLGTVGKRGRTTRVRESPSSGHDPTRRYQTFD